MSKNFKKFGKILKELRIQKGLTLRKASALANYDPSNWSKVERGEISPPSDEKTLQKWASVLGISRNVKKLQEFIDEAGVARGIIPQDILSQKNAVKFLPAFFRTARNKKPDKEDINILMGLIWRSCNKEKKYKKIIDFTKIEKGGVDIDKVLSRL